MKVTLQGHIEVPEEDLQAVLAELPNHGSLTAQEDGCVCFRVEQRSDDPCVFDVYEEFTNRDAFDHHQARAKDSQWGQITANVTRHYEITESACWRCRR